MGEDVTDRLLLVRRFPSFILLTSCPHLILLRHSSFLFRHLSACLTWRVPPRHRNRLSVTPLLSSLGLQRRFATRLSHSFPLPRYSPASYPRRVQVRFGNYTHDTVHACALLYLYTRARMHL